MPRPGLAADELPFGIAGGIVGLAGGLTIWFGRGPAPALRNLRVTKLCHGSG